MFKNILYSIFILLLVSQKSFSLELIRDTELESYTKDILYKLTVGTDIDPKEVKIHFINNRDINAFVINSKDMFINTGLITASDNYLELVSVIAHELSHMTGFHVSRTKSEIARLSKKALPVYMLGIFGALTGSADTAIASMMVGTASVEGGYLSYSRTQESSADQGAIRLMCQNSINARGLISFFEKLEKAENSLINFSPYNQTHPMTKERYEFA
jgi:predicted Zn-dependent protease